MRYCRQRTIILFSAGTRTFFLDGAPRPTRQTGGLSDIQCVNDWVGVPHAVLQGIKRDHKRDMVSSKLTKYHGSWILAIKPSYQSTFFRSRPFYSGKWKRSQCSEGYKLDLVNTEDATNFATKKKSLHLLRKVANRRTHPRRLPASLHEKYIFSFGKERYLFTQIYMIVVIGKKHWMNKCFFVWIGQQAPCLRTWPSEWSRAVNF